MPPRRERERRRRVETGQGFLFSEPVEASTIDDVLLDASAAAEVAAGARLGRTGARLLGGSRRAS